MPYSARAWGGASPGHLSFGGICILSPLAGVILFAVSDVFCVLSRPMQGCSHVRNGGERGVRRHRPEHGQANRGAAGEHIKQALSRCWRGLCMPDVDTDCGRPAP